MTACHAIAVAAVVWSLVIPPPAGNGRKLSFEPFYEWELVDSFDSRKMCEAIRQKLIQQLSQAAIKSARCVSAEDPGLQGKKPKEPKEPRVVGFSTD